MKFDGEENQPGSADHRPQRASRSPHMQNPRSTRWILTLRDLVDGKCAGIIINCHKRWFCQLTKAESEKLPVLGTTRRPVNNEPCLNVSAITKTPWLQGAATQSRIHSSTCVTWNVRICLLCTGYPLGEKKKIILKLSEYSMHTDSSVNVCGICGNGWLWCSTRKVHPAWSAWDGGSCYYCCMWDLPHFFPRWQGL